jgi:hypothetical protein
MASFADAKIAENHIEYILDIYSPRQPGERLSRHAQLLGKQILAGRHRRVECAPQRRLSRLQGPPVTLARHQRRLAGKGVVSVAGQPGNQAIHALTCSGRNYEYMFISTDFWSIYSVRRR